MIASGVSPYISKGTTLVPLSVIAELKGVRIVSWDHPNKTVTLALNKQQVKLKVGEAFATGESQTYPLPAAAALRHNRVMVPLRSVAELSGAAVTWDSARKTVSVDSPAETSHPTAARRQTAEIIIDGSHYTIPVVSEELKRYSFAASTSKGIVWSPAPERSEFRDPTVYYPDEPYTFYLSDPKIHSLNIHQSRKLFALPAAEDGKYTILDGIYGVGDYVIYHTYVIGKGMAQAFESQAWAMKVTEPQSRKKIETFHSAGGYFHSFGIVQQDGLYVSLSQIPGNPDGSYNYEALVYKTTTDQTVRLQNFTRTTKGLQFKFDGKNYTVPLTQV